MDYGKFVEVTVEKAVEYGFIGKAISDDETRYFMNFAYCEDNKLVGTDGRRMHILNLGDNTFGFKDKTFYKFLKASQKEAWFAEIIDFEGTFPNWKRLIPKETEVEKTIQYKSYSWKNRSSGTELSYLMQNIPEGYGLNLMYVDDLPTGFLWEVAFHGKGRAISFKNGNMTAVIMPVQRDL